MPGSIASSPRIDSFRSWRVHLEIDQLVHFLKVTETENITRAGEELGLSQPAVSRSLQRLEEEIGQPLFERQSRKMVLTEAGEILVSRARQIMTIIDDTKSEIHR